MRAVVTFLSVCALSAVSFAAGNKTPGQTRGAAIDVSRLMATHHPRHRR